MKCAAGTRSAGQREDRDRIVGHGSKIIWALNIWGPGISSLDWSRGGLIGQSGGRLGRRWSELAAITITRPGPAGQERGKKLAQTTPDISDQSEHALTHEILIVCCSVLASACDRGGGKRWSEVWGMHWSLVQGVIFRRRVIIIASCWRRSMKMIRALRMTLYSLTQTREIPGGKWNWYLLNCEREERAEMRTTWSDAQSSGAWDERASSIFLDSGKKLSAKKFVMLQSFFSSENQSIMTNLARV